MKSSPVAPYLDLEEAKRRLGDLSMRVVNPLDAIRVETLKDGSISVFVSVGSINHGTLDFKISQSLLSDQSDLLETLFHEFTHVIFGRAMKSVHGREDLITERAGLAFETAKTERFVWLNEAVTEMFAQSLLREEERTTLLDAHTQSYSAEIALLKCLLRFGSREITMDVVFAAANEHLRENPDSDDPTAGRATQWRALSKAVADAYAPGFLVRLDKYVQKHGPMRAALKLSRRQWKEIYDEMGKEIKAATD